MPVNGDMPMGGRWPMHVSCIWRLLEMVLLLAELRWSETQAKGVNFIDLPVNKLAVRPDLEVMKPFLPSFLCRHGGGREVKLDMVEALLQAALSVRSWSFIAVVLGERCWRPPWCSTLRVVDLASRWPVSSPLLPHLLVERRPFGVSVFVNADAPFSSRPRCQKGGSRAPTRRPQCPFPPVSSWHGCSGGFPVPSGEVPGGGELGPGWELIGTELQFSFVIWGPFCIFPGLVCNFLFLWGPAVCCTLTQNI